LGFVKGKNSSGINNYQFTETKLSSGKYEYRLKQVDNNGNYKYYDLNNTVEIGLPVKYNLSQNYPNPFNPATKFDFALPENSKVKIDLYNVSGKKVLNIINENSLAGYYTKEINGNNLSSGVYFLVMSANSASKEYLLSKKLLLIK
jgi:ribosomal protein S17E